MKEFLLICISDRCSPSSVICTIGWSVSVSFWPWRFKSFKQLFPRPKSLSQTVYWPELRAEKPLPGRQLPNYSACARNPGGNCVATCPAPWFLLRSLLQSDGLDICIVSWSWHTSIRLPRIFTLHLSRVRIRYDPEIATRDLSGEPLEGNGGGRPPGPFSSKGALFYEDSPQRTITPKWRVRQNTSTVGVFCACVPRRCCSFYSILSLSITFLIIVSPGGQVYRINNCITPTITSWNQIGFTESACGLWGHFVYLHASATTLW